MMATPSNARFSVATDEAPAARKIPQRSEIDARYKWSVEDLYPDDSLWESDFASVESMLSRVPSHSGRLGESGPTLLEFLRLRDAVEELAEKLAVFASLRRDEDMRVGRFQSMADRATGLAARAGEAFSFVEPELLALPDGRIAELVRGTPGLALYAHALDNVLRRKPHTLAGAEERLLAMGVESAMTPSVVFGMFNNADLRYGTVLDEEGNEIELTKARHAVLQNSMNRAVREASWRRLHEAYERFQNTLAANLGGQVKRHVYVARARRYASALHAALDPTNIPTAVYRSLIETVRDGIAPLHRYTELRRRALGVDTLKSWDLVVPLLQKPERKYPWDEAVRTVRYGLMPLGSDYVAAIDEGLAARWIDVYESEGKRGGAYSWGSYATSPFMLLNYNDTLDDLFTLAHEMGHSIHSYFTKASQPYVYGSYPIFLAEVASTTNESLLIEQLIASASSRDERITLLNHYLDQIRSTFFIQTLFAEYELTTHEMAERGEPLTSGSLGALFRRLYQEYHGPALTMEPLADCGWARVPHFYYNFYVYQYATSYAAATSIASRILSDGQPAVDRYLDLLRAGGSDYPIPLLTKAGVDLTTPQPVRDTIARFSGLLDRLEALLGDGSAE
ncbi:MAG: oligoendopeptidase F [bacterium]